MAKPVVVTHGSETLSFATTRVDRAKIYGTRKRIAVDARGRPCSKAQLSVDGSQMLLSGMTAQGYFTPDDRWVARNEMVGLDPDGNLVESKPSTLGVPQHIEGPVDPQEILALAVESVFFLEAEEGQASTGLVKKLKAGEVLKCAFNYAAGLEVEIAYLVANDEGVFAIVGKPVKERWVQQGEVFVPPDIEEDADDLDFEAM